MADITSELSNVRHRTEDRGLWQLSEEAADEIASLRARLAEEGERDRLREGLAVVPVEPTEAMKNAALCLDWARQPLPEDVERVYRAMIAAAETDHDD